MTSTGGRLLARRARAWLRGTERPFILGHRGARRRAPENTMAAFELALEEGADGVELDVRLDRDGEVVVIHDADLARVTEGRDHRRVEDLGTVELAGIDVGKGERVPRLREVLSWGRARAARINIELKADVSRRALLAWQVFRLVAAEEKAAERLILSSFDPRIVAGVARVMPWVPVGYLVENGPLPGRAFAQLVLGASALHPRYSLVTSELVENCHRAELPVNVWTVNDPAEARRLNELGVDCLITDVPAEILASLATK